MEYINQRKNNRIDSNKLFSEEMTDPTETVSNGN